MIQAEQLTKIHRRGETEVAALRGVDFEIVDKSFAFIVGPSGSGKSTILHLLGALDEPSSGRVIVDGTSLSDFSVSERDAYRRNQVGFIFQNFNLLSNLTAVDNVLVPFLPRGVPESLRNEAVELLKSVGLESRLTHRPNQLSGGEQQRVAIARALLKRPGYILADEPTGELDSATGREIFGYLRALHEDRGTTVVVVTHDQSLVTDSDVVIRLKDGSLEPNAAS
ncbi:MAG: ABC transporter ATP-binding protein [Planctomycetota bacterium]|nr:ABC transporter ATP-binding protein [Planctomycetota bacterium]